jgi:hypothetical protein
MDRAKLAAVKGIVHSPCGEMLAEYRPALTEAGAAGLETEIFITIRLRAVPASPPNSLVVAKRSLRRGSASNLKVRAAATLLLSMPAEL